MYGEQAVSDSFKSICDGREGERCSRVSSRFQAMMATLGVVSAGSTGARYQLLTVAAGSHELTVSLLVFTGGWSTS